MTYKVLLILFLMAFVISANNGIDKLSHNDKEQPPEAPYFTSTKMEKSLVKSAGTMARLRCKASGYPRPNITWYKNDDVPTRDFGFIKYITWSMVLEDLIVSDAGNYTCRICNDLGCISFTYTLDVIETVNYRPILTKGIQNTTVALGDSMNFTCAFLSNLNLHIYWEHRVEHGNELINVEKTITRGFTSVLMLKNITKYDEGWYICTARNSLSTTPSNAYLKVIDSKNKYEEKDIETVSVGPETMKTTAASGSIIDEIRNCTQITVDDIAKH